MILSSKNESSGHTPGILQSKATWPFENEENPKESFRRDFAFFTILQLPLTFTLRRILVGLYGVVPL
jgi:hypothetical protein